jgi:hypothetical protein
MCNKLGNVIFFRIRHGIFDRDVSRVLFLFGTSMFPIFGDHREWNVCEIAFDHYLGVCSKFFSQLFFCSIPTIMTYTMLRFTGALLYTIEGLSWQIFLINQRILQVSGDHPDYDKLKTKHSLAKYTLCITSHLYSNV